MLTDLLSSLNKYLLGFFEFYPSSLIIFFIAIIGACVGSFINVIIYRSPLKAKEQEFDYIENQYLIKVDRENNFLSSESSHCPFCKKNIPFYFNIPIFGFLILGGRSNCCKKKLPLSYLIIEALTSVAFVGLFFVCGETINTTFLTLCFIFTMGIVISVIDFKHMIVFDLHSHLHSIAILLLIFLTFDTTLNSIINGLGYLLCFFVFIYSYQQLRYVFTKVHCDIIGGADWSLLAAFCCVVCSLDDSKYDTLLCFSYGIISISLIGLMTFALTAIISKTKNERVSQMTPLAPAIIITTIAFILSHML